MPPVSDEPIDDRPDASGEPTVDEDLRTAEEVAAELDAVEAELRALDDPTGTG